MYTVYCNYKPLHAQIYPDFAFLTIHVHTKFKTKTLESLIELALVSKLRQRPISSTARKWVIFALLFHRFQTFAVTSVHTYLDLLPS